MMIRSVALRTSATHIIPPNKLRPTSPARARRSLEPTSSSPPPLPPLPSSSSTPPPRPRPLRTGLQSPDSLISQEFVANLTRLVASGQLHDAVRLFAKEARRVPISAVPSSVWQSFVAACAMCGDARTADSIVQLLTPHLAVADPAALERIQLGAINAHRRAGNYHKVRQLADLLPTKALRAFDLRVRAAATADEALQRSRRGAQHARCRVRCAFLRLAH
jgi:hypothetical protein